MASSSRPEPGEPGAGEHDGVVVAGADLADPGVDVAADAGHVETEPERVELGGPARRAGADAGAGRQLAEGQPVAGDDDVARVLAGRDGGEGDAGAGPGRQVLERVDGQVDPAVEQRLAQRADEDAGAAELGQRGVVVSPSVVTSTSSTSRPSRSRSRSATRVRLGRREGRGAGAEAQGCGGAHCIASPDGRVTASTASGSRANSSARAVA